MGAAAYHRRLRRTVLVAASGVASVLAMLTPASVSAFCGFFVSGADRDVFNDATMVVMMREGRTTVLSMQNDYRGPPADFAMVVPVPVVLHERNVRTLPREVFERVDTLAAPRLVEYWEQDPCGVEADAFGFGGLGLRGTGRGGGGSGEGAGLRPAVRVEARFAVGEYQIVILGADDSSALDAWLRAHRYRIPDGAAEALRPYVESGMKFFVAKVDVTKVRFEDGRAVLSPLRVHYESDELALPVRLGMLSSSGTQDLIVHVLARNRRYELANYENVTIPTNIDVSDEARGRFGEFYAALFDHTLAQNPGAVVTEYAWQATGCDPCPGPVLSESDLMTLGADVTIGANDLDTVGLLNVRQGVRMVDGPLNARVVERVVARHENDLHRCHQLHLAAEPARAATGNVTLDVTIAATGAVTSTRASAQRIASVPFLGCVSNAVGRWTFPSEAGPSVATLLVGFENERSGRLTGRGGVLNSFVLTRLHHRYAKGGLGDDLVFRTAPPIVGGRELPGRDGKLEESASASTENNFQARYAIRHGWEGPVQCEHPHRGTWGGPRDGAAPAPLAATDSATAPRGAIRLGNVVRSEVAGVVPHLVVDEAVDELFAHPGPVEEAASTQTASGGCVGCAVSDGRAPSPWVIALLGVVVACSRERRARGRIRAGETDVSKV